MSLSNETSVRAEFEKWCQEEFGGIPAGYWGCWKSAYAAGMARMREPLEKILQSAEHAVCVGEDCFRCFVGETAEEALGAAPGAEGDRL